MSIKRGVSLYSYQQSQFFGQMNWKEQIREVCESLGTDGIEIIDEQLIPGYPFENEPFYYAWRNELARYDMKAVTMDVYMDVHQFRDHVMTHREAAERLKNDIRRAAKMGFQNVRCLCLVPIEVIEMALPVAEECNVRIGKEIHAPLPIKPVDSEMDGGIMNPRMAAEIIELAQRKNTKYVGLVPDFGIFQHSPTQVAIDYYRRKVGDAMVDDILRLSAEKTPKEEIARYLDSKYPGKNIFNFMSLSALVFEKPSAEAEDLREIAPYIVSMHGKFYNMTEIPGKPGCYEDKAVDYENPIRILKECGYEGYINSEFEGQRFQQDMGKAGLVDEREQVRRHHEMLRRLIG